MPKAALSISPFEGSRPRLRRTREAMGKASGACVCRELRRAPLRSEYRGLPARLEAARGIEGLEEDGVQSLLLDTRIPYVPRPVRRRQDRVRLRSVSESLPVGVVRR